MLRFNPTIRDTNRYLSKTVDELLKKYGGVSNDDFERDLVATTGIGWKQVKNYKNHPKPSERLKDNSVVIKYVRDCQARDIGRKIRIFGVVGLSVAVLAIVVFKVWNQPKTIESFAVRQINEPLNADQKKTETKVYLKIGDWVLRLGPIKHSDLPLRKFVCTKIPGIGQESCAFTESRPSGLFQVTLLVDHDFVRRYTVMTFDPNEIASIKAQLGKRVSREIASVEPTTVLTTNQFRIGDEAVELIQNPRGPGSRLMLTASVSFAAL